MGDAVHWDSRAPGRRTPSVPAVPPAVMPPQPMTGQARVIPVSVGPFAPRTMSDRANAWVRGDLATVFFGSRATGGPQFFQVNLQTDQVESLGPCVPYGGETEGWFWLPDGTVIVLDGPQLRRCNPLTGSDEIVLDISGDRPGHDLHQPHASDDGTTYTATVRRIISDGQYPYVGTIAVRHGVPQFFPLPPEWTLDESQCSRDGRHVVIKVDRGQGDDNLIVNLETGEQTWLPDLERAIGHSDMGPDYVVGEADKPGPGGCVIWYLDRLNEGPRFLFPSLNLGYVSCRGGKCLHSDDTHLRLIDLQTGAAIVLLAHGGGSAYDDRVKAALSPCGTVATYMANGIVYLLVLRA